MKLNGVSGVDKPGSSARGIQPAAIARREALWPVVPESQCEQVTSFLKSKFKNKEKVN
jgi:hypothetical protein